MIGRKNVSLTSDEINALVDAKIEGRLATMKSLVAGSSDPATIDVIVNARVGARLAELLPDLILKAMPGWLRRFPSLLSEADFVREIACRKRDLRVEVDSEGLPLRWLDTAGTEVGFPTSEVLRLVEDASRSLGLASGARASRNPLAEAIDTAQRAADRAGTPAGVEALKITLAEHLQDVGRATVVEAA